jgi:hypothetical protein
MNDAKVKAVAKGAKGIRVERDTLRTNSLDFLRAGGKPSQVLPVTLTAYPDGTIGITDGRHRIYLARKEGKTHVHGVIRGMGPRGGIVWSYTGKIRI